MKRMWASIVVILFGAAFAGLAIGYSERTTPSALAVRYLRDVPVDLGAANVVTGILITYRGFDTLGEVAVLFMVAASVGMLLSGRRGRGAVPAGSRARSTRPPSELVASGAQVVLPIALLFGAYVTVNGHLSAGGGFQGGAVVASGVVLLVLARPSVALHHGFLSVTESLAGVFYVALGILGLIFAGGFLDSHILPRGEFGAFVSAGAIPLISALLGIKVAAELSVIIDRFRS